MSPLDRLEWLGALNAMPGLTPAMFKVAAALAVRMNATTGLLNPSVSCLAKDTGLDPRSVNRALKGLEKSGIISVKRTTGGASAKTNHYKLLPLTEVSPLTVVSPLTEESDTPDRSVTLPLTVVSPKQGIEQGSNKEDSRTAVADDAVVGEFYLTKRRRKLKDQQLRWFNQFWEAFSFKKGRAEAADAWIDLKITEGQFQNILIAAEHEARTRTKPGHQGPAPKWAQGWLSSRRWEDYHSVECMTTSQHSNVISCYHQCLPELPRIVESSWMSSEWAAGLEQWWTKDERHRSLKFWEWLFLSVREHEDWMDQGKSWRVDLGWIVNHFDEVLQRAVNLQKHRRAAS
jgi:hypothetical protein